MHIKKYIILSGSEADENETKEDTLDIASTFDSRVNGSVANGTIRTIPKLVEKTDERFNGENPPPPYSLYHAAPFNDASTNFPVRTNPGQNNLGFQLSASNECPVSDKRFPGNTDNNSEKAKSSISQNATVPITCDEKLAALQHKNYNFTPLHVECDPVGNSFGLVS